jgi:hypothetical protein
VSHAQKKEVFALLCDSMGVVQSIALDELGIGHRVPPDSPFNQLVDMGSRGKAQEFLTALRRHGTVSDWEMNVPVRGHLMSLTFIGNTTSSGLVIAASSSRSDLGRVQAELDEFARINNELATLQRQFAKQSAELAVMNEQLRESLANVKELRDLLPICTRCKKIRDDQDYWHTVEAYISTHTSARFSHGFCPECLQRELAERDRVLGPGARKP